MVYRFDTSSSSTVIPINKADVVKRDASLFAFPDKFLLWDVVDVIMPPSLPCID